MVIFLDVLLLLSFLSVLSVMILLAGPFGPEGPVGLWVLFVIPCLFVATMVMVLAASGLMDFLPGGRPVHIVAAIGIMILFSACLVGRLDRHGGTMQTLLAAVPYLILALCAVVIHGAVLSYPPALTRALAILLGGAAIAGWGIGFTGAALYLRQHLVRLDRLATEERECDEQREQEDMARYEELRDDAPLSALLPLSYSRNDSVRRRARERIAGLPGLDGSLMALLELDSKDAVGYVAKVYDNPPKNLGPAYGRMLERQLKSWNSLQFDEHAGTWELNLKGYFEGAQKIQQAGADLRPQLRSWHEFLLKCKGLDHLAAYVKTLL